MKRYIFLFIFVVFPNHAHDARPIYLEINENLHVESNYEVKTKIPNSLNFFPDVILPKGCKFDPFPEVEGGDGFSVRTAQLSCSATIQGRFISIDFPKPNPSLSVLIRTSFRNGEIHSKLLPPGETEWQIPEIENASSIFREYTDLGIRHILSGYDHLLFVLCLFFVVILREQKNGRFCFLLSQDLLFLIP